MQLQEDINSLLQSNKTQTDTINELKEELSESESKLKKEFSLVENWTLEKEVRANRGFWSLLKKFPFLGGYLG